MRRSISEADCLAHYQKVDGANPSSATDVLEAFIAKRKTQKTRTLIPGSITSCVMEKAGELHGKPMRAEVVLCKLFVALLGAGLISDLAKQKAGVA